MTTAVPTRMIKHGENRLLDIRQLWVRGETVSGELTVLVLGAGSNVDFGFPSGLTLTKKIVADLRDGSRSVMSKNLRHFRSADELREFRLELLKSQCSSIDRFLQHRPEYADLGRSAIAIAILEYEVTAGGVHFSEGAIPSLFRYDDNWYAYLLDHLGDSPESVREKKLRIVTFNYDRSLERYLLTALMSRYKLSEADAAATIAPLGISHVYGSVGDLISQDGSFVVDYGISLQPMADVSKCAQRIRVVDSRDEDSAEFIRVRTWLAQAQEVAFLGFGYDTVNLKRLLTFTGDGRQDVVGTAHGLTQAEVRYAEAEIGEHVAVNFCRLRNDAGWSTVLGFLRESGLLKRRSFTRKTKE